MLRNICAHCRESPSKLFSLWLTSYTLDASPFARKMFRSLFSANQSEYHRDISQDILISANQTEYHRYLSGYFDICRHDRTHRCCGKVHILPQVFTKILNFLFYQSYLFVHKITRLVSNNFDITEGSKE